MHIDSYSFFIFSAINSIFMGIGLFIAWHNYVKEIKGGYRWAMGLLILGMGWVLAILRYVTHTNPLFSGVGATFIVLSQACFFHALVEFKESKISVRWTYYLVVLSLIAQVYCVVILNNLVIKIVIAAITGTILFFANSVLLLAKQKNTVPISHKITGYTFLFLGCSALLRTLYYSVADIPTNIKHIAQYPNLVQDINFISFNLAVTASTFGFLLMCIDKYVNAQKQAQLTAEEALGRLQKIASQVPGVVYQFKKTSDNQFSVPYCSDGIYDVFQLKPSDVYQNVSSAFNKIYGDDYQGFIASIEQSARHLTAWNYQFRVLFDNASVHWLEGYAMPQAELDGSILWHGFIKDITERKQMELELQASENRFKDLFENAPLPYQSLDIEGHLLYVNQAWLDMVGCQRDKVIGQFFADFMTESSKNLVSETFIQFKKDGYISSPIFELSRCDTGETRLITMYGRITRDNQGKFQRTHCILRDITEQYQIEQDLKESEQRFRQLIEKLPLALILTSDRKVIFINDRFKQLLGYTLDDISNMEEWLLCAYPDEKYRQWVLDTWYAAVEHAKKLGIDIEPIEYRVTCKNGIERIMLVSGIDFSDYRVITFLDITERKIAEETIKQLAFYDPLTQLPNRRLLQERLEHSIKVSRRTGHSIAVLMMDLDKFKAVNDTLGHAAGDELLKQVAQRITELLREIDTVARLGGDEFVIVLEEINHYQDVARIAEAIIYSLSQPFVLYETHQVTIGASIGIAIFPEHGDNIKTLMANADTALYSAKDKGRGCFVYFSSELTKKV